MRRGFAAASIWKRYRFGQGEVLVFCQSASGSRRESLRVGSTSLTTKNAKEHKGGQRRTKESRITIFPSSVICVHQWQGFVLPPCSFVSSVVKGFSLLSASIRGKPVLISRSRRSRAMSAMSAMSAISLKSIAHPGLPPTRLPHIRLPHQPGPSAIRRRVQEEARRPECGQRL